MRVVQESEFMVVLALSERNVHSLKEQLEQFELEGTLPGGLHKVIDGKRWIIVPEPGDQEVVPA